MILGKLSRRYAKAFFELAKDREEQLARELDRYVEVYTGSELKKVLDNPGFDIATRKKIALEVAERLELSHVTLNLVSLLVDRDRLDYLPSIATYFRQFLDALKNRVEARVTLPQASDPETLQKITEALARVSGKEVILKERIDPEILGGIVIELGGTVYDGSVRTQLESLKENIERAY